LKLAGVKPWHSPRHRCFACECSIKIREVVVKAPAHF
jgi:hypothetical protein